MSGKPCSAPKIVNPCPFELTGCTDCSRYGTHSVQLECLSDGFDYEPHCAEIDSYIKSKTFQVRSYGLTVVECAGENGWCGDTPCDGCSAKLATFGTNATWVYAVCGVFVVSTNPCAKIANCKDRKSDGTGCFSGRKITFSFMTKEGFFVDFTIHSTAGTKKGTFTLCFDAGTTFGDAWTLHSRLVSNYLTEKETRKKWVYPLVYPVPATPFGSCDCGWGDLMCEDD
jgi:hypothetical protein